jgi:hypothetical protein
MSEVTINSIKEVIPCDNINLSEKDVVSKNSIFASKEKYKNSIFYEQISGLIDNYEKISVADSLSNIDKDLLSSNTIALNEFIVDQKNKMFIVCREDTTELNNYSLEQLLINQSLYNDPLPESFDLDDLIKPVSSSQMPLNSIRGFSPVSDDELPVNCSSLNFSDAYPNLNERLKQLPFITTAELIDFYDYSFVNQENFSSYLTVSSPDNLLKTLDLFYSPENISKTSMGSFCSLVTSVFEKFDKLKGSFNDIKSFVKDFSDLINSVRNFSFTKITAKSLIESLKKQILRLIDKLVESTKIKISGILSAINIDNSYNYNTGPIARKIIRQKATTDDFFSDFSIKNIKDTIKALISYSAATFENFDLEEAQFIILRFCSFIGEMEKLFESFINPFKDIQSSYSNSLSILRSSGNLATAGAIASGATRFDGSTINSGAFAVNNVPKSRFFGSETPTGISDNGIAPRARRVINPTSAEIQEITSENFTYEAVLRGNTYIHYRPGKQSAAMGSAGWNNVLEIEKIMLLRLAKKWGSIVTINSAWRTFGAENSWHKSGQAFDISLPPNRHDSFARMAIEEGFGGFGSYPTFIHIDSRNDSRGVRVYLQGALNFSS